MQLYDVFANDFSLTSCPSAFNTQRGGTTGSEGPAREGTCNAQELENTLDIFEPNGI